MSENKAITKISNERAEEIQAMPAMSTYLPHTFENKTVLAGMAITCRGCGKELNELNIKGKVTAFTHSLAVESYAVCLPCRLLTPANMRFSDDGSYLAGDENGNWKKRMYNEEKSGWLVIWLVRLKSMFSSKNPNH